MGSDSEYYVGQAKLIKNNLINGRYLYENIYFVRKSYYIFTTILSLGYIFSNNDFIAVIYNQIVYILIINIFMVYVIRQVKFNRYTSITISIIAIACTYSALIYSRDIYIIILISILLIQTKKLFNNKKNFIQMIKIIILCILLEYFRENFGIMYILCLIIIYCVNKFNFGKLNLFIITAVLFMYILFFPIIFKEYIFENSYGMNGGSIIATIQTFIIALFANNPFKNLMYWIMKFDTVSWITTNMQYFNQIAISWIIVFVNYKYILEKVITRKKFHIVEKISILYAILIYLTYSMSYNVQQRIQISTMIPMAIIFTIYKNENKYKENENNIGKLSEYQVDIILIMYCIVDFIVKVIPKV
ncbi:hypothetical protein [Paraclostridium bifermentans]|uniref:hypothetical protein n=1 Tax=Paraclostridium bifermentans TaxID=1490 RepID=UPI00115790C1|nr:hypothetical protein [Paraclostridium bifermentans]